MKNGMFKTLAEYEKFCKEWNEVRNKILENERGKENGEKDQNGNGNSDGENS